MISVEMIDAFIPLWFTPVALFFDFGGIAYILEDDMGSWSLISRYKNNDFLMGGENQLICQDSMKIDGLSVVLTVKKQNALHPSSPMCMEAGKNGFLMPNAQKTGKHTSFLRLAWRIFCRIFPWILLWLWWPPWQPAFWFPILTGIYFFMLTTYATNIHSTSDSAGHRLSRSSLLVMIAL